jgi:hypothetical protein
MTTHHVEISTEGTRGRILIDGHDISKAVESYTVFHNAGSMPRVYIDFNLVDVTPLDSKEMQVLVTDEVAETLKVLGWTPPEDSEG